jgi:hypothetical protein
MRQYFTDFRYHATDGDEAPSVQIQLRLGQLHQASGLASHAG